MNPERSSSTANTFSPSGGNIWEVHLQGCMRRCREEVSLSDIRSHSKRLWRKIQSGFLLAEILGDRMRSTNCGEGLRHFCRHGRKTWVGCSVEQAAKCLHVRLVLITVQAYWALILDITTLFSLLYLILPYACLRWGPNTILMITNTWEDLEIQISPPHQPKIWKPLKMS